jgi:hypothetical protein
MKRILCTAAAIVLSTAAFVPTQAVAQVAFNVVVGNAPPPVRYEVVPAPRYGYEWAPGYWNWNGSRHQWMRGHWERARPGQYYQRPEWRQGHNGWELNRGGWQRGERYDNRRMDKDNRRMNNRGDMDRDGIPNRVDRDRDGDGIRNDRDSSPNNPYRR